MKKILITSAMLTLTGCIPALLVGGAEGVSTVRQERTAGERFDDNSIAISINAKFAKKDTSLFAGVATDIHEGRVLLTGKVKDPTTKKDAEDIVWRVQGVREVINEIKVSNEESFGNYISDAWISNQIRARMLLTKHFKNENFGVQTVDRVVYLMGIAQDDHEEKVAIEIARRTPNVQRVVSHVILKTDPRRTGIGRYPSGAPSTNVNSNNNGENNNNGNIDPNLPD